MKLLVALLISLSVVSSVSIPDSLARGGGGGGHGGGGGYRGGGGGYRGGLGNRGYYGRNWGGYGGYYNPNWGGYDDDDGYGGGPPPYAQNDPLADYYNQQAASRQEQSQASLVTTVTSQAPAYQQQLPTDLGGLQLGSYSQSAPAAIVDEANDVRDNFHRSDLFTPAWWKTYGNAWCNLLWPSDWVWNSPEWNTLAPFLGLSTAKPPSEYEYGVNIKYLGSMVYYGTKAVSDAADYYKQAKNLAATGTANSKAKNTTAPPAAADWRPLGVFSLVRPGQKDSNMLFQLAVNRSGQLRGNCYNMITAGLEPVIGFVDKANSRVAWTAGKNTEVVYDSGLANLLSAQSPILVHLNANQTDQYNFIRLRQPASH